MGELIYTVGGDNNLVSCKSAAKVPFDSLKVEFAPVQSGSGDPSPSNVRPINGWTGVNVSHCGKNLYNSTLYPVTNGYWISSANGGADTSYATNFASTLTYIPFAGFDGKTLTLNKRSGGNNPGIAFYSGTTTNTFISGVKNNNETAGTPMTFTVPNGTKYMRFTVPKDATDIQIEVGSATTTYEPYTSTTYPVSWQSEAGTVYGGYVDLMSGVLIKEWEYAIYDGSSDESWNVENRYNFYIMTPTTWKRSTNGTNDLICNVALSWPGVSEGHTRITSSGNLNVHIGSLINITTVANFRTWLASNNLQIACKLNTPVTYQLTPQQLTTFLGRNNIWNDVNGNTIVSYPLVETGAIREAKRRVMNQPKRIQITWNQKVKALSMDNYEQFGAATSASLDITDGIGTMTWVKAGRGDTYTCRPKEKHNVYANHQYYLTYMLMPDFSGGEFSVEYMTIPTGVLFPANIWSRYRTIITSSSDTQTRPFIPDLRSWGISKAGDTCKFKSLNIFDLTLMYGAGNEPDIDTFEKQCLMNGVNLEDFQGYDQNGTQRWWII